MANNPLQGYQGGAINGHDVGPLDFCLFSEEIAMLHNRVEIPFEMLSIIELELFSWIRV